MRAIRIPKGKSDDEDDDEQEDSAAHNYAGLSRIQKLELIIIVIKSLHLHLGYVSTYLLLAF